MNFRKRLMIAIALTLGLILVLGATIFFLGTDIQKRAEKISLMRADLSFRTKAIESLAELRSDFDKSKPYEMQLKNMLPTRDQLVNFSRDFNVIANQNKINLNLSFQGGGQAASETATLQKTDFLITTQGSFSNLLNFLKATGKSRYFIKTNSLDLTAQGGDNFNITINGHVFSL